MRNSYDQCLDELASHGLGPRTRSTARRVAGTRQIGTGRGYFAKSLTAEPASTSRRGFDGLLDHLFNLLHRRDMAAMAAEARSDTPAGQSFVKALGELDRVYRATAVKPIVIRKDALAKRPSHGDTIAKAFHLLEHGNMTAEQRGRMMIALSDLNDRVFAKSQHPMVERIDDVQVKLDAALASGHAGSAEGPIREALTLIKRGHLAPADHARLSLLFGEIRTKIEENSGAKDQ